MPDPDHPRIGLAAITTAGTLTLWAFLGLESATVPAGKVVIGIPARVLRDVPDDELRANGG